jgi:hypothetical protein
MNYNEVYNRLIQRSKLENRFKSEGKYYELHHIVPLCMGGNDDAENLVLLTAREHFISHWLLSRIYPNNSKISYAFWMMCVGNIPGRNNYIPSSRAYSESRSNLFHTEESKKKISESLKGKIVSDETRGKMSDFQKGKIVSDESRKKMSDFQKGKIISDETRKKMSESRKGITSKRKGKKFEDWYSEDMAREKKEILSNKSKGENNPMFGLKKSEEEKRRISEKLKGKKLPPDRALKNKLACLGRKYINKDGVKKKVKPEELDEYFKLGWKLGQK